MLLNTTVLLQGQVHIARGEKRTEGEIEARKENKNVVIFDKFKTIKFDVFPLTNAVKRSMSQNSY